MLTLKDSVSVLGTKYKIIFKNDEEVCQDVGVPIGDCGGYCSWAGKEIVLAMFDKSTDPEDEKENLQKWNARHEIVHAFLSESGLSSNANGTDCWSKNEEMVDWFALQGPKIYKAWQEAGAV